MERILFALNIFSIVAGIGGLVFAVKNYKESKNTQMQILESIVAPNMSLCGQYIRDLSFFRRKNGGTDPCKSEHKISYVNHIEELKAVIEE